MASEIEDIYPLSALQEGMLFHSLLDDDSGVYVLQDRYTLRGRLDPDAFLAAWQAVVDAHPALRTSFVWQDQPKPLQIVRRRVQVPASHHDLSAVVPEEQEAAITALLARDAGERFDLARDPLLRVRLVELGGDRYAFLRTFHHILMDAWSVALVTVDFVRAYEALRAGRSPEIARARPYRDFVRFAERRDRSVAAQFFRPLLARFEAPTPLPLDAGGQRERYLRAEERGDAIETLPAAVSDALRTLCREHGLTPNTVFQSLWAWLLARYSGQRDVLFGVTVAGRPASLAGVERMVGLFINTVPLAVGVDPELRALDWLKTVQAHNVELRDLEHTPLAELAALAPFGTSTPLFDSLVVYENAPVDHAALRGEASFEFERADHGVHTHYGLTLVILPDAELRVRLSYDRARFAPAAMQRVLAQLVHGLRQLLEAPTRRVGSLELLTPAERARLAHWNASGAQFPLERGYAALVAEQVAAQPTAIAAREGERELSYGELWRQSGWVAHSLLARGVGRDRVVAVLAERGLSLLSMITGVLRAGGAFLALEPAQPPARLAELIRLSGAREVLIAQPMAAKWSELGCELPALAAEPLWQRRGHAELPPLASDPSDLAYVVFTSGSTGVPKGVLVEQAGMLNNMFGKCPTLGIEPGDRIAQTASCAFDISVWQLLAAPLLGAEVEIVPDAIAHDPAALARSLDERAISIAEVVPAVLRGLLEAPVERFSSLRWLLVTGEAAPAPLCQAFLDRFPAVRLMNAYGPAECSDDVSMYEVAREPAVRGVVPIGRPTANNRLYVVDAALEPLPAGATGEIVIAGAGVGRGYLGDPERTAESFVLAPQVEPGSRIYRTGDLGRFREDGILEFAGRRDQQVKLRGHRIELGEIESRLARAPEVREAGVVLAGDQLVGYVALRSEAALDRVRERLARELPSYMVPMLVALSELPHNANGKLDRPALLALGRPARPVRARVAPRNELETALLEIWSEVLGATELGVHDDFFELGGHSLLAIQISGRIRARLQRELPLRALFASPTIAGSAEALARAPAAREVASLPRLPRPEKLPLSFAQQRLWFLETLQDGGGLFHVPFALRLRGALDVAALADAFRGLIQRHEVLRTALRVEHGEPHQVVLPDAPFELPVYAPREGLFEALQATPFDLAEPPLVRAALVRARPDDHVLYVVLHHLISDAWSATLAIRELAELYRARVHAEPARLPPLTFQYPDFALWQRSPAERERGEAQLRALCQQLSYEAADGYVLDLPADRPRPAAQSYRSGSIALQLTAAESEAVRSCARVAATTPYAVVFAAFAALLHRVSGRDDLLIGTPASNRQRPETEQLLGVLLNNWVIRSRTNAARSFAELLGDLSRALEDARGGADVPFERLVDALQVPRTASHAPVFQVMIAQQLGMERRVSLPGLELELLPSPLAHSEHDLDLHVGCGEGGPIEVELLYSTDLFDRETAERWLARLRAALPQWLTAPDAPLAELDLSLPDERAVLEAFNRTEHAFPLEQSYAGLLAEQVRRTPAAIVAGCEGESLSYAELWRQSGGLARKLLEVGVERDARVVLLAERGLPLLSMLVGVLRARGAFLALEVAQPVARLAELVGGSGARVLLFARGQERLAAELVAHVPEAPLLLCAEESWSAADPELPLQPSAPDDLAYVVFTSGSTGTPKGVMIEQRGFLNNLYGKLPALQLTASDRIAQTASCAFDISVWQFLAAPLFGAQLEIFGPAYARDPVALYAALEARACTVVELVPAVVSAWLDREPAGTCASLRWLLLTGEAASAELCQRVLARFPHVRLLNAYGPAECSDDVAMHEVRRGDGSAGVAPLGRPTPNNRLYVVDAQLRPVPLGTPGEIVIGGAGVGRGYLGDPDKTRASFVSAPWLERGGPVYRSGDRGWLRRDGVLEFAGRQDQQIKLRGHRIELGEIEAKLARADGVRDAAVVVHASQLVAFWTGEPRDPDALRAFLQASLPDYMLPASFVHLPELPRTSNGKLDRSALARASLAPQPLEPPADALERTVATTFAEVLQLAAADVGRSSSFFELGGHSLLATVVIARLSERTSAALSLRALFEAPRVRDLARRLREATAREQVSIGLRPRPARLPLAPAQERLWFLSRLSPESAEYNVSSALLLEGSLDVPALQGAFDALLARHEILRSRIVADALGPRLEIDPQARLQLHSERFEGLGDAAWQALIAQLAAAEAARPFALGRELLVRARLVERSGCDQALLLLTFHHCVSDDWSAQLAVDELSEAYRARTEGRPARLPPLPIQYPDYALWTREPEREAQYAAQLEYWRRTLEDGNYVLALPTTPRAGHAWEVAGAVRAPLPAALTERLREYARERGITPFSLLLAATNLLLSSYANQRDIRVGVPVANRNARETQSLLGCFINTLVIRSEVDPARSFEAHAGSVQARLLEAQENADLPFERLVEALVRERDLKHNPLFQVLVVMQTARIDARAWPGLSIRELPVPTPAAQFDLCLEFHDDGQQIDVLFEYRRALWSGELVARMRATFEHLLGQALAAPARPLSEHSLQTAAERAAHQRWNATEHAFPLHEGYAALLAQRVARTPEVVVARCGEERLTYAQLWQRSAAIAGALIAHGIERDDRVAVVAERGLSLVCMLVGVLRARGAFLALEIEQPVARLAELAAASGAKVVLASQASEGVARQLPAAERIWAEPLWAAEPPELAVLPSAPDDLAYVVFTSGSTGAPKAVQVEQAGMLNNMFGKLPSLGIHPGDRIAQTASVAFDISVWQLLAAPILGAELDIVSDATSRDPAALLDALETRAITIAELVPAVIAGLLDRASERHRLASLRWLLTTGEAAPGELAARVLTRFPHLRVLNAYGPAECSDDVAVCELTAADGVDGYAPIGWPTPNNRLYVVDDRLRPLPHGAIGEIVIAGLGVGRGYLADPERTAASFVVAPQLAPGRVYRSGDLGRYRDDGVLLFAGRRDEQIKLRGHRIELGEIESRLRRLPAVRDAAVLLVAGARGEPQLVAYCELDGELGEGPRAALRRELPAYMVPARFIGLAELPRSPNGKLDKRALALRPLSVEARSSEPPHGEREAGVAEAFARVLELPVSELRRDSSFFELGGHSLLATRLLGELNECFGVAVPLRTVFEHPTVAALAAQLPAASRAFPAIRAGARPERLPLSAAQERLWVLAQLAPDSPEYNIANAFELDGPLDVPALSSAFEATLARHEILRSRILQDARGPHLQIDPPHAFVLPVRHIEVPDDRAWQAEMRAAASAEAARAFDLARDRLLRVELLERAGTEARLLLLTLHHCIADDWSSQLLVAELAEQYQAARERRSPDLRALPIQYPDYALWSREPAQQAAHDRQLEYWRGRLEDGDYVLELPPLEAAAEAGAGRLRSLLPASQTARVRALASELGTTPFVLLLTLIKLTLGAYANQRDVRVGIAVANRERPETQSLLGCFVNTLVLRSELAPELSGRALVAAVQRELLSAHEHGEVPFERVVHALAPERNLARTPLFQVLVVMQTARIGDRAFGGLALRELDLPPPAAPFELTVELHDEGRDLAVAFEYRRARFAPEQIARMHRTFEHLLGQFLENTERSLLELSLVTPEEGALLAIWNDTRISYAGPQTLRAALREQLERTPDATAVRFGSDRLTYRELHARAREIARALRQAGAGPGRVVALCLERSFELMTSVVGVIEAGAAYLPIDPELPEQRIAFMLEDADAVCVLTQERLRDRMPASARVFAVEDSCWRRAEAAALPESDLEPSDLAYVIYTSGSTGQPKGVLTEHAALMNRLHWMQAAFPLTAADRVLHKTPYSFDVSVWELFWALITGAELVVAEPGVHRDALQLRAAIARDRISVLHFVPSMLRAFVAAPELAACASLRRVFASGEALPAELVERWYAGHPAELVNLYGPTEAAIDVSCFVCPRDAALVSVPIGRPVANTQLCVLDASLRPLPIGAVGELCIGGVQLARGYLNRPELTAARFVQRGSERLYRTGDRARHLPDGRVEYLGRDDDQVKLRGFRIELGEIAAALASATAVRDAVVIVSDAFATAQLVAYVVLADGHEFEPAELQRDLRERLPEYMVPSHFVAIERLPVTRHGKLDRRALPAPQPQPGGVAGEPRTQIERVLCELVAELLELPRVAPHEDFFALGADSIAAILLASRARERGLVLSPQQVFSERTLEKLARVTGTAAGVRTEQGVLEGSFTLLPIQRWFFAQTFEQPARWNQSALLRPRRRLEGAPLAAALRAVVEHHDALRLRFSPSAPELQTYASAPECAFELECERVAGAGELAAVLERHADGLDLERGPLVRAALLELPDLSQRLYLVAHHLVIDAYSWRILVSDLTAAYRAVERGDAPKLPAKTSSYRQWCERVRERGDAAPQLTAAVDRVADERRLTARLSLDETRQLIEHASPAYRASVQELLVSALALLEPGPVSLDLEGHGRDLDLPELDVSRTVGWFTTLRSLTLDLGGARDVETAIRSVKEQLRAAEPAAVSSEASVLFNYLGELDEVVDADWELASEPVPGDSAADNHRTHRLELVAGIRDGQLEIGWHVSRKLEEEEARLAMYLGALRRMIERARAPHVAAASPSDFPLAKGLHQAALDKLLQKTGRK